MAKNQIAEKANTEVTESDAAAEAALKALLGHQEDNADSESYSVPFIKVLQSNSPWCDPQSEKYNQDARPGMIVNTVTGELFKELRVVEAAYIREFIRWGENRGGFVDRMKPSHPDVLNKREVEVEGKRRTLHPDCDDSLVDTRQHYVLFENTAGNWRPAILPLSSTGLKVSRDWRMVQNDHRDAGVKHIFNLSTVGKSNDQGNWYIFNVATDDQLTQKDVKLLVACNEFAESIRAGQVTMDESELGAGNESANAKSNSDVAF